MSFQIDENWLSNNSVHVRNRLKAIIFFQMLHFYCHDYWQEQTIFTSIFLKEEDFDSPKRVL